MSSPSDNEIKIYSKIVIFLKQFFDTGRVVNTKYGFFSWTNDTQQSFFEFGGDNNVNSLPILFQDLILSGKKTMHEGERMTTNIMAIK